MSILLSAYICHTEEAAIYFSGHSASRFEKTGINLYTEAEIIIFQDISSIKSKKFHRKVQYSGRK